MQVEYIPKDKDPLKMKWWLFPFKIKTASELQCMDCGHPILQLCGTCTHNCQELSELISTGSGQSLYFYELQSPGCEHGCSSLSIPSFSPFPLYCTEFRIRGSRDEQWEQQSLPVLRSSVKAEAPGSAYTHQVVSSEFMAHAVAVLTC